DVGGVEEGQKVTFSVDAFPNRPFHGSVRQVRYAPSTNQNVVTYTTVVDVDNTDLKLRPGMTANASIVTAQRTNVLKIPNAALRFRPPDNTIVKTETNAPGSRPGPTNGNGNADSLAGGAAGSATRGGSGGGAADPEERRRRWESMSPEQRAALRERMRARFGDGGPPGFGGPGGMGAGMGGSGGSPRATQTGPATRTVYL